MPLEAEHRQETAILKTCRDAIGLIYHMQYHIIVCGIHDRDDV
jgi:hypothetical protein